MRDRLGALAALSVAVVVVLVAINGANAASRAKPQSTPQLLPNATEQQVLADRGTSSVRNGAPDGEVLDRTPAPVRPTNPPTRALVEPSVTPTPLPTATPRPATPAPTPKPKPKATTSGNTVSGIGSNYPGTAGYMGQAVVALPGALGGRYTGKVNGYVTVCADRCVRLPVVDWCQCYWGTADQRVVDLSHEAWAAVTDLPLSRGLVKVRLILE